MRTLLYTLATGALCACAAAGPPVTSDSRDGFDTVKGMYGGNEFSALSPEGKRQFQGQNSPAPAPAPANTPAPAQTPTTSQVNAAPAVAAASVTAPNSAPAPAPQLAMASAAPSRPIAIDPNAFAAVFGTAAAPVKPTADQLMQLDSISLMAADSKRMSLQQQILACRRAGDACRLTNQ